MFTNPSLTEMADGYLWKITLVKLFICLTSMYIYYDTNKGPSGTVFSAHMASQYVLQDVQTQLHVL